jgi:hypothetical protein
VPTFENGWICRQCWCANREFDARCYRCHADRPEEYGTLQVDEIRKPADAAPAATFAAMPLHAEEPAEKPTALTEGSAARQPGRYCLRCGNHLLAGAGFCTQCGAAAVEEDSDLEAPTPIPAQAGSPISLTMPRIQVPRLDARSAIARARQAVIDYRAQHRLGWEVTMSALAIAFVTVGLVADRLLDGPGGFIGLVLTLMTAVSVAEYLVRLGVSADRVAFVRGHLIELAAIVPPLRGLRVLTLLWLVWLEPLTRRVSQLRIPRPHRPQVPAVRHRPWLPIAWSVLLVTSAVATYGYASSGGVAGREPQFALLLMILATFSGLTASMATWYADSRRMSADEIPHRLNVLAGLSEAGTITPAEFAARREALLSALSPMADGPHAEKAGIAPTTSSRSA